MKKNIEKLTQQVVEATNTKLLLENNPDLPPPPPGKRTEMEKLMMQTLLF